MPTSFANKKGLRFVITLATGTFGSSSENQVTLEGFRATVDIDRAGGAMYGEMHANIYGVSQSAMNAVTGYQYQPDSKLRNKISVYAIDGNQETLTFQGDIVTAWGNYHSMPDVFLQVQARAGYYNQLTPVAPTSFNGPIDVATVMGQLAATMGYVFENNGVSVQLSNPYLSGTAMDQANELVHTAGIAMYLDDDVLAITPLNQPRQTLLIPEISAQSGMVGYPTFDGRSVNFSMLFNPAVKFGGQIQVVTDTPPGAAGTWYVASLAHSLSSEKPNGPWFTQVSALKIQLVGAAQTANAATQ